MLIYTMLSTWQAVCLLVTRLHRVTAVTAVGLHHKAADYRLMKRLIIKSTICVYCICVFSSFLSVFASFRKFRCTRNYIHINLFSSFVLRASAVFIKDTVLFADETLDHCSVSTVSTLISRHHVPVIKQIPTSAV